VHPKLHLTYSLFNPRLSSSLAKDLLPNIGWKTSRTVRMAPGQVIPTRLFVPSYPRSSHTVGATITTVSLHLTAQMQHADILPEHENTIRPEMLFIFSTPVTGLPQTRSSALRSLHITLNQSHASWKLSRPIWLRAACRYRSGVCQLR
jgi:hypothetical protein